MRFSIIIPVYNVAEYLRGCVDSILANDCSDCEIILVDDGATDGICPGLCDEIGAENPGLVRVIHQENQGPGGARNTGLKAAKGEYVFFVDSDDTIAPDSLTILGKAVDKFHADVYSFQLYTHDGTGPKKLLQISQVYDGVFQLADRREFLLSLPAIWARIFRRDLFLVSGIRFPGRVWCGEDLRTTTKLMAVASSIVTLPDPLYYYLQRPGSIMRSGNVARCREIMEAFDDVLAWFREHGLWHIYQDELCRLAVDHVLLAATVRVAKVDPRSNLLTEFSNYIREQFPNYRNNPYLNDLSRAHKFLLRQIQKRRWGFIALMFRLKGEK